MGHKIVFKVGPPGCGKGTQARRIVSLADGKVVHKESSDAIRDYIREHPWIRSEIQAMMGAGRFAPDNVVISAVEEEVLSKMNSDQIIDGFPRTVEQARFALTLADIYDLYFVLYQLEREVCFSRIVGGCRGRVDDDPKVIQDRLDEHFKHEQELYDFIQTAMPEDRVRIQYAGLDVEEITRQVSRFLPFEFVAA